MVADLSNINLIVSETGFNDTLNPTEFTLTVENTNPPTSDGSNTVYLNYGLVIDFVLQEDYQFTLTIPGGETKTGSVSWTSSVVDGAIDVTVGAGDVFGYDGSNFIGYDALGGTFDDSTVPFKFRAPQKILGITNCSLSSTDVSPSGRVDMNVSIENNGSITSPTVLEMAVGPDTHYERVDVPEYATEQYGFSYPLPQGASVGDTIQTSSRIKFAERDNGFLR